MKVLCSINASFILCFYVFGTFPVLLMSLQAPSASPRIASWATTSTPTASETIWRTTPSNQVSSSGDDSVLPTELTLTSPLFALWHPVTLMPFALLHSWKRNRHSLHGERVLTRWKWIFRAFIRVNSSTNNCSAASDLCFVFLPLHRRNSSVIWYDALSNAAVQLVTWQRHSPTP